MKSNVLFLFFSIFLSVNQVFAVHVDSISVYTKYHSEDSCQLFLYAKVTVGQSPCSIQSINVNHHSDKVSVVICYEGGFQTAFCPRTDSVDLGIQEKGIINIISIFQDDVDGTCKGSFFYKDTFEFQINTGVTDINHLNLANTDISICPNPAGERLQCKIEHVSPRGSLQILTLTGAKVSDNIPISQNPLEISTHLLLPGVYLLQYLDEKQRLVKRFVKY